MPLARTRASRGSARGRRGRGAGFPTADTAPPTPGHIPREFWYSMLQVMTGPRREASGLLTIAKSDYGNPKTMRFLSPYAGGDDILIVEETPAGDVHVDDAELGAFLDEIN
ncbi:unnamed protein product [Ectocarpus sp. 12 AP-2014]